MKRFGVLLLIALLLIAGCSNHSSDSTEKVLDPDLESVARTVYSANDVLTSSAYFNSVMNFSVIDMPEDNFLLRKGEVFSRIREGISLKNSNLARIGVLGESDSTIFIWPISDGGKQGYVKVTYDAVSDKLYLYVVYNVMPPQSIMQYDSVLFTFIANRTLDVQDDDRLVNFHQTTLFKDNFIIQNRVSTITINEYNENGEIADATLEEVVRYASWSFLIQKSGSGHIQIAGSDSVISLAERLDFKNQTFVERSFSYNNSGTGTFNENRNNKILTSGTFDIVENDGHGEIHVITQFPENAYIVSIARDMIMDVNPELNTLHQVFSHKYTFRNGSPDTAKVMIDADGEFGQAVIQFENSKGESGNLTFVKGEEYNSITGWLIDREQRYYTLDIKQFADQSMEYHILVYASRTAFENGENPIAEIHLFISSDGSGSGELAMGNDEYQVTVQNDGTLVLEKDGVAFTVNGFKEE